MGNSGFFSGRWCFVESLKLSDGEKIGYGARWSLHSTCTTTSSDLQHQTSQGRRWRLGFSEMRSNIRAWWWWWWWLWGRGGDEKDGDHLLPWQAHHTLPIACMLHHASFHDITAHLWSQTEGSQLWSCMKQHKEDKWEIHTFLFVLEIFYKIKTFLKRTVCCMSNRKKEKRKSSRSFSENIL